MTESDRTPAAAPSSGPGGPRIAVLGAGPAGIATALALTREKRGHVSLYDQAPVAGGNSASFDVAGVRCDYGSHRFHPVADPRVLQDVKDLLGKDLLLRPRHGRIRLGGRWIHFPLKLGDALRRLPPRFAASLIGDMAGKKFRKAPKGPRSFSSVLYQGLGPTISENFYFPYVRKLWGLAPDELAVTLAERRVGSGSIGKILGKMLRMLPGLRGETTGRFFYPRNGFGQIGERMLEKAVEGGTELHLGTKIAAVTRDGLRVTGIETETDGVRQKVPADLVLSTLPLTALVRVMDPPPPSEVVEAAKGMRFRGMILIYLVLGTDRFTEYDAHYFPEIEVPISRMSEPKNYNAQGVPQGRTVLCAELPCDPGETWWSMSDDELGAAFAGWLGDLGLPVTAPILETRTRRLSHAYPVYDLGYEAKFRTIDAWLSELQGLLVFGRQGLFAHDNTHHAFAMAYAAAEVVGPDGSVDRDRWAEHRHEFESHRVED